MLNKVLKVILSLSMCIILWGCSQDNHDKVENKEETNDKQEEKEKFH